MRSREAKQSGEDKRVSKCQSQVQFTLSANNNNATITTVIVIMVVGG